MTFKVGDLVRFRETEEEWDEFFALGIYDVKYRDAYLKGCKAWNREYEAPIKIEEVDKDVVGFENKGGEMHYFTKHYLIFYEDKKKQESYVSTDGFVTNPSNWDKGLGLL